MATCTAAGQIHENNRWREMGDRRLLTRLNKVTKPDKLACFLNMCQSRERYDLLARGIERCNELGYAAMETTPGWYSVMRNLQQVFVEDDIAEEVMEQTMVSRNLRTGRVESITTAVGVEPSERAKVGKVFHKEKPKKKKSLYSRKLRTKRRL